ncbi:Gfo/Idh/MocA family protein [Blastopirellula marina]|uniref:Gfo/Idh/MocA family protein n=1 Tax=Blastopirellula marina TaxID=124 RepID=UPI001304848A|nr:Gfo/Idh/MocA family oxidoreductase [Blastopirellula marina]
MPQLDHHVLVVGAGSIGHRHLRCFRQTGRCRVGFVDPRETIRHELGQLYPDVRGYESLEQALDDPFDSAVIATPAPLHVPQSLQLLEAGLHLLIEKPLCLDLDEAQRLETAASQRPQTVNVAYVYRANPLLSQMREAIFSGEFGRPVELIAYCGQHFPTYRPAYRETYYRAHDTGGGAIQDALTHVFNAAQWLIGNMQKIAVDADHKILDGVDVEDTVHAIARHENDVMATYTLNQHQAANELTITVICENGVVRLENHQQRWRTMSVPDGPWTDHQLPPFERDELFTRQANLFLDAVEGKALPLCPLNEGVATLQANLAALSSWRDAAWKRTDLAEVRS